MREIKFDLIFERVKESPPGYLKEMESPHHEIIDMADLKTFLQWLNWIDENPYWSLKAKRQFAGLKDENGKDIYDGDILNVEGNTDPHLYNPIIFKHGGFGYEVTNDFVILGRNYHYFDLMKGKHQSHVLGIIGNIYENPELLEVTQ